MLLIAGMAVVAVAMGVAVWRRVDLPRFSLAMLAAGLVCWSLAAGGAVWRRSQPGKVMVMVDVSASTRGAAYRKRAELERRIRELIGDLRFEIVRFADGNLPDVGESRFADVLSERTVYSSPGGDAVLLFSDGRFELPASGAPTYPVIDPNLEQPNDAAVRRLSVRGDEIVAKVSNSGAARELSWQGTGATKPVGVGGGAYSVVAPVKDGARVAAGLNPGDAWPENDALSIAMPPPALAERWWVGEGAPAGWRRFDAGDLPQDGAAYLAPGIIVLNDVPAERLPIASQQRLDQYVRELGGGLMILGGDHAFGAGGYAGTLIESLSPLASTPPEPVNRWVVLVDGSGSMAADRQWEIAGRAVGELVGRLPPNDVIAVGSFAEGVTWWSNGKSVAATKGMAMPPGNLSPHGPTNLKRAMEDVTRASEGGMVTQFVIITDGEAEVSGVDALGAEMKRRTVRLHVLAIGEGAAVPALKRISSETGGSMVAARDAGSWSAKLNELGSGAMPRGLEEKAMSVSFKPAVKLPARVVGRWNRTWIKEAAEALAEGRSGAEVYQPAARWQVGSGQVGAVGFSPAGEETEALAAVIGRKPGDPRFKVLWDAGEKLSVAVDGVEGKRYLNGETLVLEVRTGGEVMSRAIPQIGPGRYEVAIDAPRSESFAAVRVGGRLLDQIAVAGRYPAEFDLIGNDHVALHELAQRTGGEVIDSRWKKRIEFKWPRREVALESWLAAVGALCLGVGLGWWRIR